MSNVDFKILVTRIQNKPSYVDHIVTDRGQDEILVSTTKGWFLFAMNQWTQVTNDMACNLANNRWLSHEYDRIVKGA